MKRQPLLLKRNFLLQNARRASTITRQGTPAEYCRQLVRKHDYENFLCTLLLPRHLRETGFAIRAFNVEVAQVQDHVRQEMIGAMRLKFWADTLNKIYEGAPPRSPIATELDRALKKYSLSKRYFKRLIDCRVDMLSNSVFLNVRSLEEYSENSVSPIYYLLLEACGIKNLNSDHVASHLGKAHGIVTLLRSVPYHARRRTLVLPQDILMRNGVSNESVLQGKQSKQLSDAVFQVASCAEQHLQKAIALRRKVQYDASLVFLPIKCVDLYLEDLRQADFDVFNPRLQQRNNLLPLQLFWEKVLFKVNTG